LHQYARVMRAGAWLAVLGLVGACAGDRPIRAEDDVGQGSGRPDDIGGTAVPVLSGTTWMGCNPGVESSCATDETPYHGAMLSSFEIDRAEVTKLAYYLCMRAGSCTPPAAALEPLDVVDLGLYPVVGVTWAQASAYCAFLGWRLPTEAEWERAARGSDARLFPWGEGHLDCQHANLAGCERPLLAAESLPAGASAFGALHMAGNAAEWVADWYAEDGYVVDADGAIDPVGPATGVAKVVRGGSFLSADVDVRASARDARAPGEASVDVGFRCARGLVGTPGVD
jgi:formylglycine-generating enzyme required for sulfatase activity